MAKARVSPTWQNVLSRQPGRGEQRPWSYRLCGCCEDCKECCCSFMCTPCYMCMITKRMNEHCCSCWCGGPVALRTKIRVTRKIKGTIPGDLCACVFCPCCTLVQMGREAKDTEPLI